MGVGRGVVLFRGFGSVIEIDGHLGRCHICSCPTVLKGGGPASYLEGWYQGIKDREVASHVPKVLPLHVLPVGQSLMSFPATEAERSIHSFVCTIYVRW